jgi:DNA-binding NarL/FixJ family response regulator
MAQWGVELVVGKLLIDEAFRRRFDARAHESLATLCEQGIELTDAEVAALLDTERGLWSSVAALLDPRLHPNEERVRKSAPPARQSLTSRERAVLRGVFAGQTNKQIASELAVSVAAVKGTLQHLFRKTQVRTRAQLVRIVFEGPFTAPRAGHAR